jgi:hypothetical protein
MTLPLQTLHMLFCVPFLSRAMPCCAALCYATLSCRLVPFPVVGQAALL